MQNTLVASFSNHLKDWMAEKKMSQSKLSAESGLPQPMISRIVSGKWGNLTLETVRRVTSVFGIDAQFKFTEPGRKRHKKEIKIPDSAGCFWDVDVDEIDLSKHVFFVAERILNYGGQKEIRWLFENVENEDIRRVVKESKVLSEKSKVFWSMVLGLN